MGGGNWVLSFLTNDNSYVDDNGCQIINNHGQVIRRRFVEITLVTSVFAGDLIDPVVDNMYKASHI